MQTSGDLQLWVLGSSGFPTGLRHLPNEGSPQAKRKEKRGVRGSGSPPGLGRTRDDNSTPNSTEPWGEDTGVAIRHAHMMENSRQQATIVCSHLCGVERGCGVRSVGVWGEGVE